MNRLDQPIVFSARNGYFEELDAEDLGFLSSACEGDGAIPFPVVIGEHRSDHQRFGLELYVALDDFFQRLEQVFRQPDPDLDYEEHWRPVERVTRPSRRWPEALSRRPDHVDHIVRDEVVPRELPNLEKVETLLLYENEVAVALRVEILTQIERWLARASVPSELTFPLTRLISDVEFQSWGAAYVGRDLDGETREKLLEYHDLVARLAFSRLGQDADVAVTARARRPLEWSNRFETSVAYRGVYDLREFVDRNVDQFEEARVDHIEAERVFFRYAALLMANAFARLVRKDDWESVRDFWDLYKAWNQDARAAPPEVTMPSPWGPIRVEPLIIAGVVSGWTIVLGGGQEPAQITVLPIALKIAERGHLERSLQKLADDVKQALLPDLAEELLVIVQGSDIADYLSAMEQEVRKEVQEDLLACWDPSRRRANHLGECAIWMVLSEPMNSLPRWRVSRVLKYCVLAKVFTNYGNDMLEIPAATVRRLYDDGRFAAVLSFSPGHPPQQCSLVDRMNADLRAKMVEIIALGVVDPNGVIEPAEAKLAALATCPNCLEGTDTFRRWGTEPDTFKASCERCNGLEWGLLAEATGPPTPYINIGQFGEQDLLSLWLGDLQIASPCAHPEREVTDWIRPTTLECRREPAQRGGCPRCVEHYPNRELLAERFERFSK